MSRKQVAWLNIKYVTEEALEQAIVKVINAYNKFELPSYWGSGKHASADGTKWGRLRKRKIKHAKKVTRFSTAFADPSTADKRRERPKSNCFSVSPENV